MNLNKEPLFMTWGRIRSLSHQLNHKRLIELVEKFNHDLAMSKVQEKYWIEGPDGEYLIREEVGKNEHDIR